VLRNTVDYDQKVRTFSLEQMNSAILASFILKLSANVSEEKQAKYLENFKKFYQNNGSVLIQESGTEIVPIERSIIDTKVIEVEMLSRCRVATVFNIPGHMPAETKGKSYSRIE